MDNAKKQMPATQPALFLDRDGVIVEDCGYLGKIADIHLIEDIIPTLIWATEHKILICVITNQSGIARGYYSLDDCHAVNRAIAEQLNAYGVTIKKWYVCPHHVDGIKGSEYAVNCHCRKPQPGLIEQAVEEFDIDPSCSLMVGDKPSDIIEIQGLSTILVQGRYELAKPEKESSAWLVTTHRELLSLVKEFYLEREVTLS